MASILLLQSSPGKQPSLIYFFTIGSIFTTSIAQSVFLTPLVVQLISALYPVAEVVIKLLLVLPKVPELSFREVCSSLSSLPLNPLWNSAIPHGALGSSCQLLSLLSVTSSNSHITASSFPCYFSQLDLRPGPVNVPQPRQSWLLSCFGVIYLLPSQTAKL